MKQKKCGWEQGIFYIGSYGEKSEATIHVCKMDKQTGELNILQRISGVENASFLALHPEGHMLYVTKEIGEANGDPGGEVAALPIDPGSGLLGDVTSSAYTGGGHPCYISVNEAGTGLYAANYTGGSIALFPLAEDGQLQEASSLMQHEGEEGPVADRQKAPHAHCVLPMPGTSFICAVDLGMDAIVTYRHDETAGELMKIGEAKVHAGAGPRHIVYHPKLNVAYVANELDSSVTLLRIDREIGELTVDTTYSTLPSDYTGYNDSADIHVSSDGRFLYSSNRGHNSIAVFAIDGQSGELAPIQNISCGGELPRNFGITPEGDYLLVANGKTNNVVVFRRNMETGKLEQTDKQLEVNIPVCILYSHNE